MAESVRLDAVDGTISLLPKPDAPLTRVRRALLGLINLAILLGIAALVVWKVWPENPRRRALAMIVASSLVEVRSPTEGEFVAVKPLPNGACVKKGQVLGSVRAPRVVSSIEASQHMLDALQQRKLLLDQRGTEFENLASRRDEEQEFRQISIDVTATENELKRLRRVEYETRITAPVDGKIHYGLDGSKAVRTSDTIAYIWPEGGDLLLEVKAPLSVIHGLIQADRVDAVFPTVGGNVAVTAKPIAGSLRTYTQESAPRREDEYWGSLQCTVESVPEVVRIPGLLGGLQ